jgi:hypothetical protein
MRYADQSPQIFTGAVTGPQQIEKSGDGYASVATTEFPFDEIDERLGFAVADETLEWSDVVSLFSQLLRWIVCKRPSLATAPNIAARAAALQCLLDPSALPENLRTLSAIAREYGLGKACVSKALVELRDTHGIALTVGKLAGSRDSYRQSTAKSLANHTHSSYVRHDLKSRRTDVRLDAVAD